MNRYTKVIYNCKQATFLIEKKSLAPLTFRERIELRIHLSGCSMCRLYQQQSEIIGQMVKDLFKTDQQNTVELDDQFKQDMQNRIEEKLNKN